ncbi:molybdate transport system ATP-binding protein [Tistlia consotensis]|uniref:Molybdate transport system ATP-binding protein n=1 Tax=Tistlia consotensis USBA 355 TaxID=560819 RepID=A0A1Y6BD74_9PROT|nr:molybdenum ABC transporter ATP-binding protein [Tistlia consotensis]SMF05259.1 molybdate transport system ATP-binding protein [Tistlia consotensis USBA 355]SNR55175.1 molybdate transport system ATP-binding protein [Tistlia consotensis]
MLEIAVEKRLGDFRLDVKVDFEATGIVALFGRSGSGKTSLVNLLAGLLRPDRGRIAVDGRVLFDDARGIDLPPERRRLGYVFQEGRLFPHLTVRDNLLYGRRRVPRAERAGPHFERVGIERVVGLLGIEPLLARRPSDLSGGEKQRVALGRALLAAPRLLLMDEPLAALDQPRKEEVLPFIEALRDELGIPIVYVSHSMEEILRLADTMVLMSEGRAVAHGALEDLTSRLDLRPLTGRYEAGAVISVTVAGLDLTYGLSELRFAGGTLLVPRLAAAIGSQLRLRIRARDVSLALSPPGDISIQNVLPAVVADIGEESGLGPHGGPQSGSGGDPAGGEVRPQVDVRLDLNGVPLWARITRRSLQELALAPGKPVYALIKTSAIDRFSLGRPPGRRFLPPD